MKKHPPTFDPLAFWSDKTALELAALVHILPEKEKIEILNVVRGKALKLAREWAANKPSKT